MPRALDPLEEVEPASSPDSEHNSAAPTAHHHPHRRLSGRPSRLNSTSRCHHTQNCSCVLKNLVVVVPSPSFTIDHCQPANSPGPPDRLSQGILMPLFPSMSGQLNAIAREFDFPSTMGISLYCKVVINGTTMTPRISECSWKYLSSHFFSTKSNSGTQETVTIGSIEFDIDLNKAAWVNEWISGEVQNTGQSASSLFTYFTRGTSTNFVDNGSLLTSRASQVTQTPPQFPIEHSLGYGRECQQGSSQASPLCPASSACSGRVTAANDAETSTERLVTYSAPGVPAKVSVEHSGFEPYLEYSPNVFPIYSDANSRDKEKITVNLPSCFPWLYIFQWVYPYITPYPELCAEVTAPDTSQVLSSSESLPEQPCVNVKLPATYPSLDIYPPVYPWNVLHIYPQITISDCCITTVKQTHRPPIDALCTCDGSPSPRPYLQGPTLCPRSRAVSALHGPPNSHDKISGSATRKATGQGTDNTVRRNRKAHEEVHATVSRFSQKKRNGWIFDSSHLLHDEALRGGVGWSQGGHTKPPLYPPQIRGDTRPCILPSRPNSHGVVNTHTPYSAPVTLSQDTLASSDIFPVVPPVIQLPPPSVHSRSAGVALPPALVVCESPLPRIPARPQFSISRISRAMKSIIPRLRKSNSLQSARTLVPDDNVNHTESHSPRLASLDRCHLDTRNASTPDLQRRFPLLSGGQGNQPLERTKSESRGNKLPTPTPLWIPQRP